MSKNDSLIYNLTIKGNSSVFEVDKYNANGINSEEPNRKNDCNKFKIVRTENELNVVDQIESAKLIAVVPNIMRWELEDSVGKFLEYNTKTASTIYNNQKWIAEYTTEIPIGDGPFVFKFLPGLITKVESENEEIIFQIVSIKKIAHDFECDLADFKKIDFGKYLKVIYQKQEIENSLLNSLQNLPGINVGDQKIGKIEYDPVKYMLK